MRGIEDMQFATEPQRDGRFVGVVREFPKLRTRPYKSRLDAVDEIVRLASLEIRDIYERMGSAKR